VGYILGVDDGNGHVYEGESNYGAHLVWPLPIMTPAMLFDEKCNDPVKFTTNYPTYYFREDLFDPVSRIRRGRFYKSDGSKTGWSVMPNQTIHSPGFGQDDNGMVSKTLSNYSPCCLSLELKILGIANALVVLGDERAFTIWTIIHLEAISTGEELVTLKARQSFGALPEVQWSKIPNASRSKMKEELDRLENEYRKAAPESVVDRAREAATAILNAWIKENIQEDTRGKKNLNDLGPLIQFWEEHHGINQGRGVACAAASIAYAAKILQRFHSRGKHIEKERLNLRPLREQDAELAVQCIGVILCDLGWAEWR